MAVFICSVRIKRYLYFLKQRIIGIGRSFERRKNAIGPYWRHTSRDRRSSPYL